MREYVTEEKRKYIRENTSVISIVKFESPKKRNQ